MPKSFVLKYRYEQGSYGYFQFILDIQKEVIYLYQYSEGAIVQERMLLGQFRDERCALDFIVSANEKVTINFDDDFNLTYFYRSESKDELEVISKFNFN